MPEPPGDGIAALRHLLDGSERARADRFRFSADHDAYVAAHALLRVMLSRDTGIAPADWRFRTASGGKPGIEPSLGRPELRFSLSHTRGMVACAVGRLHDLGVDVEACDPAHPSLDVARRFFAPAEVALIASQPPARRTSMFYRIWTLKEAYLKATGEGITVPLAGFAFSLDPVSIAFAGTGPDRPDAWQFAEFAPGPRHRLALAVRRPAAEPVRIDAAGVPLACCLAHANGPD